MTKHDYQAALRVVEELPYGKDTEEFLMGARLADYLDEITSALKLAAIVTGEPSEGMKAAGEKNFDLPKNVDVIFTAMIAEAQRQAAGV